MSEKTKHVDTDIANKVIEAVMDRYERESDRLNATYCITQLLMYHLMITTNVPEKDAAAALKKIHAAVEEANKLGVK